MEFQLALINPHNYAISVLGVLPDIRHLLHFSELQPFDQKHKPPFNGHNDFTSLLYK